MRLLHYSLLQIILLFFGFITPISQSFGQNTTTKKPPLRVFLDDEGSNYIQFAGSAQVWTRFTQNNPGSTVFGESEPHTFDVSLRRFRLAAYGQLSDNVFFYTVLGNNNFNYLTDRSQINVKVLDALLEYKVSDALIFGAGKSGWRGLSRYAAPHTSKMLGGDAPIFAMATVNIQDDLVRKLSIYAKGRIDKLDYRFIVAKPFISANQRGYTDQFHEHPTFNSRATSLLYSTYLKWQFRDKESQVGPYSVGTYHGKKRMLNLGFGVEFQPDALHSMSAAGDSIFHNLKLWAVDFFYENPLNAEKNTALTLYAAYLNYDFGKGYIRNVGVNNPTNGTNDNGSFAGRGNAFPMIGTGESLYGQIGFLLPKFEGQKVQLQTYLSAQYSEYDRLDDPMLVWDAGVNFLLNGHKSKITLNIQNRPIFEEKYEGMVEATEMRWMGVLQYQVRW